MDAGSSPALVFHIILWIHIGIHPNILGIHIGIHPVYLLGMKYQRPRIQQGVYDQLQSWAAGRGMSLSEFLGQVLIPLYESSLGHEEIRGLTSRVEALERRLDEVHPRVAPEPPEAVEEPVTAEQKGEDFSDLDDYL